MTFHDRAKRAFGGSPNAREDALRWLEQVQSDWRETEKALSRTLTLLATVALGFLFVVGGDAKEFSLAGLKVSDMGLVALMLALLFFYLYSSAVGLLSETLLQAEAFDALVRLVDPKAHKEHFQIVLFPPSSWVNMTDRLAIGSESQASRAVAVLNLITGTKAFIITVAPVLFGGYMLIRLFGHDTLPIGLTIAASVVAVVLALSHWPVFFVTMYSMDRSDAVRPPSTSR